MTQAEVQTQTSRYHSNILRQAYTKGYEPEPITFENFLDVKQTQWLRLIVKEARKELNEQVVK